MIACTTGAFFSPRLTLSVSVALGAKCRVQSLLAHKAPVMQVKPMILRVETRTPPRYSSFDQVERPLHFRNVSAGHVCHPNHVFFAIILQSNPYTGVCRFIIIAFVVFAAVQTCRRFI